MPLPHQAANPTETLTVQRVYLIGFMGAGKSTVGRLLSKLLQWQFFDSDQMIESSAGKSVPELFDLHGEAHFRRLEAAAIRAIQTEESAVISLGGGAIETEQVRTLLANDSAGAVVFLEAPLDRLIGRCAAQDGGVSRPLLRDAPQLRSRYESRVEHYRSAHLTVATEELTPEDVAASILNRLAARKERK